MLSLHAIERVGPLDSDYFYGFEDVDWCLRAREAGLRLAVAYDARARHAGSATLGRSSPERIYYATRNHLRCFDRRRSLHGPTGSLRAAAILGWNFAFALRQPGPLRWAAVRAVWEGLHDARLGRWGPRVNGGVRQRID